MPDNTYRQVRGFTRKIFTAFVAVSVITLIYFNTTTRAELWLLSEQFPEIGDDWKMTIIRSYKMAISVWLFFMDIILVGPFAYLGYFSEHIKPRKGNPLNNLGFFDFGLLLALWFTLTFAAGHWFILDAVSSQPQNVVSVESAAIISLCLFLAWAVLLVLKIYSYSRAQRTELKKYAIRF